MLSECVQNACTLGTNEATSSGSIACTLTSSLATWPVVGTNSSWHDCSGLGRAPVIAVMSSDHVTATPANATTVGDFADLLNGTIIVPTDDTSSPANPYTVCLSLRYRVITSTEERRLLSAIIIIIILAARGAGEVAELAATRKCEKYANIPGAYSFLPIAVETLWQPWSSNQWRHRRSSWSRIYFPATFCVDSTFQLCSVFRDVCLARRLRPLTIPDYLHLFLAFFF